MDKQTKPRKMATVGVKTGISNLSKHYRESKLAQGVILMPPNLDSLNRLSLIRIIREQAEIIASLKKGL